MNDYVFAETATTRYRVSFMTPEEYYADCTERDGSSFDASRIKGVIWTLWLEKLDELFNVWDAEIAGEGTAPTRKAAIGRAKTAAECLHPEYPEVE